MQIEQSCVSEAQKYQGNLYREKPSKLSRKSIPSQDARSLVPRKAYVEDAPDVEVNNTIAIVDPPPPAPTPPSAADPRPVQQVNVFDFLVAEETPNASKVSLGGSHEQMRMIDDAPHVFEAGMHSPDEQESDDDLHEYDSAFEENGYSYGTEPIPVLQSLEYQTPASKGLLNGSRESVFELDGAERRSTDKKRKRHQVEELDLTAARRPSQEKDEIMADAPPAVLHSGLTGGLNRLLSKSKFPPSPDYSGGDGNEPSPVSPIKRTKSIISKDRGRKASSALVKIRKLPASRRTSDESSRPRKHHRPQPNEDAQTERPKRKLKAIEYHGRPPAVRTDSDQQLVLYRSRAEHFLSFVTKGPESDSGCSINKALKRYHRERGLGLGKAEEEKELWKSLRLRRNERGEVVVLF